jgi:antagonist of KipI
VPAGAVQLPPGQPIVLMADHATTGGYEIGATIITADLPLTAQLAPGDWIEFESCTLEDADRALLEQEARLAGV